MNYGGSLGQATCEEKINKSVQCENLIHHIEAVVSKVIDLKDDVRTIVRKITGEATDQCCKEDISPPALGLYDEGHEKLTAIESMLCEISDAIHRL